MTDVDNNSGKYNTKSSTKSKKSKKSKAKFTRTVSPISSNNSTKLRVKKLANIKKDKSLTNRKSRVKDKKSLTNRKSRVKKLVNIKDKKILTNTEPKLKVSLKKSTENTTKKTNIKTKKINMEDSNILNKLIGEILINTLINESNKHLNKRSKNKMNDLEYYNSEEDEDYIEESEFEDFPSDIEYTDEEQIYVEKLDKVAKNELMFKEFILAESKKKEIPIRFRVLSMDSLSTQNKVNIIDKLDNFYSLDKTDNEYHKLSTWVNWLEKVPFGTFKNLDVNNTSSPIKIGNFLKNAKDSMDKAVFGHIEAKEKILTVLTKQISNPTGEGTCIAIQGPPGNGKTTLIKEGVCKALGRHFAFIALGGMQDSSFMTGHEYTYEGSKPGRIIEILSECGSMNPVIYFDELDKISQSPKGDEIANLLCHLTDSSQNKEFHDKYMSGIDFDLSKAIFIFSYNNEENINPILLDRLFKIKTDGFDVKSKITIAKQYLVPRLLKDYNIQKDNIVFADETINSIINNYTNKEKGVRNLKRCLETIVSKINVLQYLNAAQNKIEKPLYGVIESEKNHTITIDMLDKNPLKETKETASETKDPVGNSKTRVFDSKTPKFTKKIQKGNKKRFNLPKITIKTYIDYGRDVLDLEGDELQQFAEEQMEDYKYNILKNNEKRKRIKIIKQLKKDVVKEENIPTKLDEVILENIKVSDIVKFNIKNFKFPVKITDEMVKIFIKKTPINPSIEHLYM